MCAGPTPGGGGATHARHPALPSSHKASWLFRTNRTMRFLNALSFLRTLVTPVGYISQMELPHNASMVSAILCDVCRGNIQGGNAELLDGASYKCLICNLDLCQHCHERNVGNAWVDFVGEAGGHDQTHGDMVSDMETRVRGITMREASR